MALLRNSYCLPTCFLLPLLFVVTLSDVNDKDLQKSVQTASILNEKPHEPFESSLTLQNAKYGFEMADLLPQPLAWPLSSLEDVDGQGVIGEYPDSQESTEITPLTHSDQGFPSAPTASVTDNVTLRDNIETVVSSPVDTTQKPTPEQLYRLRKESHGYILHSAQSKGNDAGSTAQKSVKTDSQSPFLLSGTTNTKMTQSNLTSKTVSRKNLELQTPSANNDKWKQMTGKYSLSEGEPKEAIDETHPPLQSGEVNTNETNDSWSDQSSVIWAASTVLSHGNNVSSATPCKTTDESWTATLNEDSTATKSVHPFLALSPFLVPLYSDWNSAFATWGIAWEAHIYGMGSVFILFCLISAISLLGLPLRCPPGSSYISLLHFFVMAFTGIQAFNLLFDAYSSQDRLPLIATLLLYELPWPCLLSTFSFAFLLLSLRSRNHLSLPLVLFKPISLLPKPCLLLCMSLLSFTVSLGCVGLLQLFHSLPPVILLLPRLAFVVLSLFLSCFYLIFFCFTNLNNRHVYRLNNNVEDGGSPEVTQPAISPFCKLEDWKRATGAGAAASLCFLGCGALQLYGILHALGLGGVMGVGLHPWPWWGYQLGCRLCECGVCLGLSVIGTHPVFCQKSPTEMPSRSWPGSGSPLSFSSPLHGKRPGPQNRLNSPKPSFHESWSQSKQEKLPICDIATKGYLDVLPLCSTADASTNVNGLHQTQGKRAVPVLPSPQQKVKSIVEPQLSSHNSSWTEIDSTKDLRPPSPINLSRSIDQALFSESLFSHSLFTHSSLFRASSSASLNSPGQGTLNFGLSSVGDAFYRTCSCGDVDKEAITMSHFQAGQEQGPLGSNSNLPESPEKSYWRGRVTGSTKGHHTCAHIGHHFAQSSFLPHLPYHRHYRTLSLASQDSGGCVKLAASTPLSESKQLEWELAMQAEFVKVCKQIDALSICSDTIEL